MIEPRSRHTDNPWNREDEDPLWLLTPDELADLPKGTLVHSINGETKVVGSDYIDGDTRFGMTAFGLRESEIHD